MSKAYADLKSALPNLIMFRRDAFLHHAHSNLEDYAIFVQLQYHGRLIWQCSYERAKAACVCCWSDISKECFPYKKKKGKGGHQPLHSPQDMFYQDILAPQYMVQQCLISTPRAVAEEVFGGRRGCRSGSNTLSISLNSSWIKTIIVAGLSDYYFPYSHIGWKV